MSQSEINRRKSRTIHVGNVPIGGNSPISVQSMTNTDTADVIKTSVQIKDLSDAGSELVRITVNSREAARAVPDIRNQLDKIGPEVNQMKYEFVRQELRVDKLEKDVAAARDNLEAQLAKIVVLRDHLDGGGSMFVSKGQSFTVKDVQKDIKRRWDLYKTQESVVTTKEQVLQAQQAGLEAARQKIAETEGLRETLEVEIAQLEARQKLVEVTKTSSEISFDDSRIARLRESLDDIRSRLEVEEHVVNNASAADFGGIPIEDEIEAGDLMAEIDRYLGGSSESVAELVH